MNRLLLTFGEIIEKISDFFVTDYLGLAGWIWTVIVAVALIAIIVIIVACVKHGKKKKAKKLADAKATEEAPAEEPAPEAVEDAPVEEPAPEVVEEVPVEESAPEVVEEVPAEEPAPEAVEEVPVEEPAPEAVEEAPAEESAPEVVEEPAEEPAPEAVEEAPVEEPAPVKKAAESKVYHISKRKTDLKWQVKMSKGAKAIKLFNTQAEAIEYAKKLAINQDARIVIHKEDGSFRKITYKKNK